MMPHNSQKRLFVVSCGFEDKADRGGDHVNHGGNDLVVAGKGLARSSR